MYTLHAFFFIFHYNQPMHNYTIKVYIITVSLCNLYSSMFWHFHVIIRDFTTNALLSYRLHKLQL